MLKACLYELELQKREAERVEAEARKTDIGRGHQIRSNLLQVYPRSRRRENIVVEIWTARLRSAQCILEFAI
jgi:protein subunit release factor B